MQRVKKKIKWIHAWDREFWNNKYDTCLLYELTLTEIEYFLLYTKSFLYGIKQ